jgi:hypothetical protein
MNSVTREPVDVFVGTQNRRGLEALFQEIFTPGETGTLTLRWQRLMETETVDTIIIGGGLSGMYAAFLLAPAKRSLVLLEARSQVGGRILCPAYRGFHADLGPSWYWPMMNPRINALIDALRLKGYPQFETGLGRFQAKDGHAETIPGYPMQPPAWRIDGGMISLVEGLRARIPQGVIRLNHPVCEIERCDDGVRVTVGRLDHEPRCRLKASRVILALPPRLAARSILFTPDLPYDLAQAMLKASTWMAGHAKFFALYELLGRRRALRRHGNRGLPGRLPRGGVGQRGTGGCRGHAHGMKNLRTRLCIAQTRKATMKSSLFAALEKVHAGVGQGSVLEQIDKRYRKQQRLTLFEMLETVDGHDLNRFPVVLYKHVPQIGKKQPALLRFHLPGWKNYDEIFWQSLGDYIILAVHRVKDLEFDRLRGRLKLEYFAKIRGRIKYPGDIREIIQKIACLVDSEALPTDFTRFRRMAERRGSLGEMSKEQAAIIGAALKFIEIK